MAHLVSTVLAHQGGWDEILFVLAPLLVFAGLLALARTRAGRLDAGPPDEAQPHDDPDHGRDPEPERGPAQG